MLAENVRSGALNGMELSAFLENVNTPSRVL